MPGKAARRSDGSAKFPSVRCPDVHRAGATHRPSGVSSDAFLSAYSLGAQPGLLKKAPATAVTSSSRPQGQGSGLSFQWNHRQAYQRSRSVVGGASRSGMPTEPLRSLKVNPIIPQGMAIVNRGYLRYLLGNSAGIWDIGGRVEILRLRSGHGLEGLKVAAGGGRRAGSCSGFGTQISTDRRRWGTRWMGLWRRQ